MLKIYSNTVRKTSRYKKYLWDPNASKILNKDMFSDELELYQKYQENNPIETLYCSYSKKQYNVYKNISILYNHNILCTCNDCLLFQTWMNIGG
jgi:hypothetical protein